MLCFFPRDILDKIWDLIESVLRVFLPTLQSIIYVYILSSLSLSLSLSLSNAGIILRAGYGTIFYLFTVYDLMVSNKMWDLIIVFPDHCFSINFSRQNEKYELTDQNINNYA